MSRKRAAIAGIFAVIYPGLGHVYLREWIRAIGWFGTAILVAAFVIPESAVVAFETADPAGFVDASDDLPIEAVLALSTVRLLNVIDAAWIGLRSSSSTRAGREETACPHCGGELDPDLDFCPWCTQPVYEGES